jgi:parallel beta-helix repeat protein
MLDRVIRCSLLLTLFMFLLALTNVTPVTDLEGTDAQSIRVVSEPEKRGALLAGTPHGPIAIDGDANFTDTALLEGWPGDGSPESPFIIDGLDIDRVGAASHGIRISNTRVSFTLSNCYLTSKSGEPGAGIYLENVTNGELVNNTCSANTYQGIALWYSIYNTVANNTCSSNDHGIVLYESEINTVVNNTCNSNTYEGIHLGHSNFNTVVNNTCNSNNIGISLYRSDSNIVVNNTCNSSNLNGIILYESDFNLVTNNTEHDIVEGSAPEERYPGEFDLEEFVPEGFDPVVLLLVGLVGITLLGSWKGGVKLLGWWKVYTKHGQDDVIIPARYRIASWFRKRRSVKPNDVDEDLEPDSSEE